MIGGEVAMNNSNEDAVIQFLNTHLKPPHSEKWPPTTYESRFLTDEDIDRALQLIADSPRVRAKFESLSKHAKTKVLELLAVGLRGKLI